MQPPVLHTRRLVLRPLKTQDAEAHRQYINDWEVARYLGPSFPWPYPENGSKDYIARHMASDEANLIWAITMPEKHGDMLLGVIELRPQEKEGQRGFWLGRPFHNQGIMSEAIAAMNDYWFDVLKRPTLRVENAQDNGASSRLKVKSGARLVETTPSRYLDPTFTVSEIWETTAAAWEAFKKAARGG